ncbi:MAG TPA: tryptophan 2,3-dioxygenase family protein, partial [Pyrinomonadaceae bacterium]
LDAPADDAALARDGRQKLYGRRTRAVLEVLTHFEERGEEFLLSEALIAHDEHFQLWRAHHVRMVERMVGTKRGTGGSEGVGYLRTTLDQKFFPELWEARTYLDSAHGSVGCPFAGPQT